MRRLAAAVIFIAVVLGPAAAQKKKAAEYAKENDFSFFFPEYKYTRNFTDIDEAYDHIEASMHKLKKTIGMPKAKGLAAKLIGPERADKKPISVSYFLSASDSNGAVNVHKEGSGIESSLKNLITASIVYVVFCDDRAVSISEFYIKDGYRFSSNSQPKKFTFGKDEYSAEYPFGWGLGKAFEYLKKERD
ncbi:MAG TPA: hypothetical protein PL077_09360 [Treponemataceae bacterium]|nr:hypothetical protein [Treponemataceae bacterium]